MLLASARSLRPGGARRRRSRWCEAGWRRLLPRLIEEGLPVPRTNVKLRIDGNTLEVDLLWDRQRLAIETDGEETHATRVAFQRDRWRDQLLVAAGYRTARVTWAQVRVEPNAVVQRIARMLTGH